VVITSPANDAVYELGAEVLAEYECSDATAGVESCTGPVASGALIDTSTEGLKSFAVTATDLAGNTTTLTQSYTVEEAALEPADLAVSQGVGNETPVVGSQTQISLSVSNNGPASASGVEVSHALGDGLIIESVLVGQGSYDEVTGLWTVGELPAGSGVGLTLT
jgi:uncharacterized repeat protein (TIGR01451 family)